MNFRNLAENLIIVIVSASVGGFIGYSASINSNKQSIELLTPTIKEAILKVTNSVKNEITHDIDLTIEKVKKSDSLSINIIQTPATKQSPVNQITPQEPVQNACPENSICIPIKNLTRRQKKRLDLL